MSGIGMLLATLALQQQPADLVVLNAKVYTADVNRPVAEAFAVRAGRIAFVGSTRAALARVVERAKTARPGEWIRGRGWDQNDWADTHFPTNLALSRAVPNNPVCLTRVDGHAALVNAKALELAQVTAATPDPIGGRFIRDSAGSPTG